MNQNEGRKMTIPQEEVSVHAYYLWQRRGCPIGSPEEDWFRAEREVLTTKPAETRPLASRLEPFSTSRTASKTARRQV
jgi:Protein of unknown function (DUF2934)